MRHPHIAPRSTGRVAAVFSFSLSLLSLPAAAQCGFDWQPGPGVSGPDARVVAVIRSAAGDLIAGGNFQVADRAVANGIARWDGTTWQAIGPGIDGPVFAVAELANGDLVAGGSFQSAGGVPTASIARWDGSAWHPLGLGTDNTVLALAALPTGDLIVGGNFAQAGGVAANRIARWDGSAWSPIGGGIAGGQVNSIVLRGSELVFGGTFQSAGGVPAAGLARWDGVGFTAIPGLGGLVDVQVLRVLANGDLAIGGQFAIGGQSRSLAAWNGSVLQGLSPPVTPVRGIALAQGTLFVAGGGSGGAGGAPVVARFDNPGWTDISAGAPGRVFAVTESAVGNVIAAGDPVGIAPARERAVASYDGQSWTRVSAFAPARYTAVQRLPNGDVVVGGSFREIDGVLANNIARWNGSVWSPLGLGVDDQVTSLALASNGDLLVGGMFLSAGGAPAQRIARYDGTTWATVGVLGFAPYELAATANGRILARGASTVGPDRALFDGQSWGPLSLPGLNPIIVADLVSLPDGSVVIAGLLQTPQGISFGVRYDGLAATSLGAGSASAATVTAEGDLLLFGNLEGTVGIARFVDGALQPIVSPDTGFGQINTLLGLPNGDLVVAGRLFEIDGLPVAGIARYDGGTWSAIDVGLTGGPVGELAVSGAGELFAIGSFSGAGDSASSGIARALPICPATVQPFGAGCTGGGGPSTLAAESLPWIGSTFRSTAIGLAPVSLGLHVIGSNGTIAPLPLGAPGCSLFVDPVFVGLLFPQGGSVAAPFAIPRAANLVGLTLRTQVVGLELDAALQLVRTTATNALELTVGAL